MALISIVMPVYNAGEYLERAVESILKQTFDDFELLIMDDGSSDGSYEMLLQYHQKDDRVRLFRQVNGGICKARNELLNVAKGTYVVFCDHDDEYCSDFLENAIKEMLHNDLDVVVFGYKYIKSWKGKKAQIRDQIRDKKEFTSPFSECDYFFLREYWYRVWGCMYNLPLIQRNNIQFDESIRFGGEDILFNAKVLESVEKIRVDDRVAYIHFQREGKSTAARYDKNRLETIERQIKYDREYTLLYYKENIQKRLFSLLLAINLWTYLEKLSYEA